MGLRSDFVALRLPHPDAFAEAHRGRLLYYRQEIDGDASLWA
jgi:hypothetical protein